MTLSVPEVLKALIDQDPGAPWMVLAQGGVVVGALDEDQIKSYGISVEENGWTKTELYLPLVRARFCVYAMGPTLRVVNHIKNELVKRFHYDQAASQRIIVTQPSSGEKFLVHSTTIVSGPRQGTNPEIHGYQQEKLILSALIGTDPIS